MGVSQWFPVGPNDSPGWRLDVVTLLAVIGESSMAEHSQAITASFLCLLPRILPAPQALLKPTRPARMPETTAKMAGVYGGVVLDTVGFFANIIQPLDELPAFAFKVLEIRHSDLNEAGGMVVPPSATSAGGGRTGSGLSRVFRRQDSALSSRRASIPGSASGSNSNVAAEKEGDARRSGTLATGASVAFSLDEEQGGQAPTPGIARRRTVQEKMTDFMANPTLANTAQRPAVPPAFWSPVHVLSVFSFLLTVALLSAAGYWHDGAAIAAIGLLGLASSVVGYASWWRPILMNRSHTNKVPQGDVVIRTREGAFVLVRCTEDVARELYSGTEECEYRVGGRLYRLLMGLGTLMLMVGVVLLGNCSFRMQVFVGVGYIGLNGLYWAMGLLPRRYFWDLSRYRWRDVTPADASGAHGATDPRDPREGSKSYTRTLWYAVRETRRTGWVERSGAAPGTAQWKRWLAEAEAAARKGQRGWPAVGRKDDIMRETDDGLGDSAEQHAPLTEVQPRLGSATHTDHF
ncbi:hypothetical protein NKR23_g3101 [Pleurostoma richardsiae]|uniref:Uncharacterized protein n=1 Tax=Pleurostoma richardsiae TaxID=41990 RepID=A0AA38RZM4_9PEZI|nr:hypothetical protein NKR23_g3101 [Pleurostoma richardsiae]